MNQKKPSHYETLGVPQSATKEEIKKAYRNKAKKTHPDKQGGSKEEMIALSIAYKTLSNEESRQFYDSTGLDDLTEIEQLGRNYLIDGFMNALNRDAGDVISFTKSFLRDKLKDKELELSTITREERKANKNLKKVRMKAEGKENFFANLIQAGLVKMELARQDANKKKEAIQVALKMLEDYESVEDEEDVEKMNTLYDSHRFVYNRFG